MIGFREILIIALIVVLLFGARKIPQIMGDFAKGIKSFRQGLNDKGEGEAEGDAARPAEPPRQISPQPAPAAQAERAKTTEQ